MLVTSRSFLEYQAFFSLTDEDLAGRVLDCCAGASGFAAAASSTARCGAIVTDHETRFVWTWFGSGGRRDRLRREALALFTADLEAHPETASLHVRCPTGAAGLGIRVQKSAGWARLCRVYEDETRPPVPGEEILRGQVVAPLPEDGALEAAFLLVKLDNGEWCARSIGKEYNRVEFFGQLVAYTRALAQDEGEGWFLDED